MGSGSSAGSLPVLARAHHGSVSKDQRAQIEDDLESRPVAVRRGHQFPELGIDMGAVDLVIQVEAPPSVASGLQRVGRAGHQVGEISQGVLTPSTAPTCCTAPSPSPGCWAARSSRRIPQNPLDVLAQHTIAAASVGRARRRALVRPLRRGHRIGIYIGRCSTPSLDLISGRYPSDEFAELRPRVTWDRMAGTLTGRRGATAGGHLRWHHPTGVCSNT